MTDYDTERIREADLPEVAKIEAECFAEPWSISSLKLYLGKDAYAVVAKDTNGSILGYGGMVLAPGEGQIINLAVRAEQRQKGIGSRLLQSLLQKAEDLSLESVSLEVRVSNQKAISLYQRFGFRTSGIRKHFYRHPAEDAAVMNISLRKEASSAEGKQNQE